MRQARRWKFRIVQEGRIALFFALVFLWVASHMRSDQIGYADLVIQNQRVTQRRWGVFSGDGKITIGSAWSDEKYDGFLRTQGTPVPQRGFGWHSDKCRWAYCELDDRFPLGFMIGRSGAARYDGNPLKRPSVTTRPLAFDLQRSFVAIPYWFVMLVGFGVPALWPSLMQFWPVSREIKRMSRGLCPGCGYDLRASREGCPECGEKIVGKAAG